MNRLPSKPVVFPQAAWLIVAIGFLLRAAYALWRHQPFFPGGDAATYLQMAEDFAHHRFPGQGHPPVFPLYLTLTHCLLGRMLSVTLIIQALVGSTVALMAYRIAYRLGGSAAGLWACAWVAVDPFLIYFSGVFLSETLFITLLVFALLATLKAIEQESTAWALGSGILLGLGTLCRGILLPCLPIFLFILIRYGGLGWPGRLIRVAVCVGGICLPMAVWTLYVHGHTGSWVMVDSHKGETFYWGLNPQMDDPDSLAPYLEAMKKDVAAHGITDPIQADAYLKHKTFAFIQNHPVQYFKLMIRKFFKFWSLMPHKGIFSPAQCLVSVAFMIPLLLSALIGAGVAWNSRNSGSTYMAVLGVIITYMLMNMVLFTQVRYRVPIDPLLEILAGCAWARLFLRTKSGNDKTAVIDGYLH